MTWQTILSVAIAGLTGGVMIDIDSFIKAREIDHSAKFDWALAAARWVKGALAGGAGGTGVAALLSSLVG